MTAILAALLAVSISSTDIDEFFTLPDWMPTEVSSTNTPGSTPEWYVEEFTNRIDSVGLWKIQANGYTVLTNYSLPYHTQYGEWENCYLTEECIVDALISLDPDIVHRIRTLGDVRPQYVNGDGKEEHLSFSATVQYTETNGSSKAVGMAMFATRTNNVTPIATGKIVPKATRITPDVQAGIVSTFAGYFERQYYVSQGQSNEWDEAWWGPMEDKKGFWFDPFGTYYTTNTYSLSAWTATGSFGEIAEAPIWYDREEESWNIRELGRRAANILHIRFEDMDPYLFEGSSNDVKIVGSFDIMYHSETNECSTNITFEANRHVVVTTNKVYKPKDEWNYMTSPVTETHTNRTISTMRLVEHDNIQNLCDFMHYRFGPSGFLLSTPNRPGWFDDPGHPRSRVWWSTTDDTVFTGNGEIVPPFDWNYKLCPTPEIFAYWKKCGQTFHILNYDDVWYPGTTNTVRSDYMPASEMVKEVLFGESLEINNPTNCNAAYVETTMRELIETNFPGVNGSAITNKTRRLRSDQLCNLNQLFSLMDRTYNVPDVVYPETATNFSYSNWRNCFGEIHATNWVYDADNHVIRMNAPDDAPSWESDTDGNSQYGGEPLCNPDGVHYRTSATRTDADSDGNVSGAFVIETSEDTVKECVLSQFGNGHFQIWLYGDNGVYFADGDPSMWVKYRFRIRVEDSQEQEMHIYRDSYYLPPDTIRVYVTYGRSYDFAETIGDTKLLTTQPGRDGFEISSSEYGAIIGKHSISNDWSPAYGLENNPYMGGASIVRYKSQQYPYGSRSVLDNAVKTMQADIRANYVNEYGTNPQNWQTIIAINGEDYGAVKRSVRVASASFWFSAYENTYIMAEGAVEEGEHGREVTVESVTSYDDKGSYPGEYIALIGANDRVYTTNAVPRQVERGPFAMDGKLGIITRTDWDWKTLKRED